MPKKVLLAHPLLSVLLLFAVGCSASPTQIPLSSASTATANETSPTLTPNTASGGASVSRAVSLAGQYTLVADQSEARYRVREQLAGVDLPSDAIGRTQQISGSILLKPDGTIDSSTSKFTVDLSTLQSDRSMRDNFLRQNVLQTDQFKDAVFVLTQIEGLPSSLPPAGSISFQITGNLTIRDVTKPVTWDVSGTLQNGTASGTAKTRFTFEDFNLTQPRVPVVLSIEDQIGLEVDVILQRSGS